MLNYIQMLNVFRLIKWLKNNLLCRLIVVTIWFIFCLNAGVFFGEMIAQLIFKSGALAYLEKFFSWIIL
jgi:hypothetical protein